MDDATVEHVTSELVAHGLVRAEDRERARRVVADGLAHPPAPTGPGVPRLVEVIAYVGGALVLAAGAMLLALGWDDLGEGGQVGALALVAVVLGVAGLVARDRSAPVNDVRRRLAGTLLGGAAVVAGFATAVLVDLVHDGSYDTWAPGVLGGAVTVLVGALGYRLSSSAAGQLAILGGALVAVPSFSVGADDDALWVGGAFLLVGLVWIALVEARAFSQRTVARSLGCSTAVFGAQFIALATDKDALGYVLTAGLVVGALMLYLAQLDWPYLAAAVIGITFVVPEAVSDWTGGDLSAITGVLITGITLLVASFAGYRLRDETADQAADETR